MKQINPNVLANIEELPTILINDPNFLEDLEANLANLYIDAYHDGEYSNTHANKSGTIEEYYKQIRTLVFQALENILTSE